jgi:hypothetical protein
METIGLNGRFRLRHEVKRVGEAPTVPSATPTKDDAISARSPTPQIYRRPIPKFSQ